MDENTPAHIKEAANKAILKLLPEKSSDRYWKQYQIFQKWCADNSVTEYNESVLLAYFDAQSVKLKSSSLWSAYSMLKSTLNIKHNINIEKYSRLISFLKRKKDAYQPKKSKVLEMEELQTFIREAPNENYLLIKAVLIIGICAACRRHELTDMKINNVKEKGDIIVITISDTKTKKPRTSCITDPQWVSIVKAYMSLRPKDTKIDRFFLFYANNKCTKQPVGIHSFGNMPSKIAAYLKLDNPKQYTGHCFRRSSATVLAGSGADITTVKRHGGWKSTAVAESYIEESLGAQPSTSSSTAAIPISETSTTVSSTENIEIKLNNDNLPNICLPHLQNCTINFNFK